MRMRVADHPHLRRCAAPILSLIALFAAAASANDAFEIPVVPCDLLAGECRDAAVRPVRNGAWAGIQTRSGVLNPMEQGVQGLRIRSVGMGRQDPGQGGRASPFVRAGIQASGGRLMPAAMELGPKTVTVKPGTTVLIEISLGHLNRIVTPFANAILHTVSTATTEVKGGVIYLATNTEDPVSLYVTDGSEDETALALTLAPRFIPPREIRLRIPGYQRAERQASSGRTALANERMPALTNEPRAPALANAGLGYDGVGTSSPYVAGLVEMLRASARGTLLPGWKDEPGGSMRCRGLKVRKTRLLVGPTAAVVAAGVRNSGPASVSFDEGSCTTDEGVIAAAAAWPRRTLAAGEETEVFLVVQQHGVRADPTGRPRD
jgi:conjugal transfer pilus assembly protein TraK